MNRPPDEYSLVAADTLRAFVRTVFERAEVPRAQAALLAELLTTNDLRGVFSHGTQQTAAYVGHFKEGRLNPRPEVRVVAETPSSLIVDGDGGLGYFPAHLAATLLGPKALQAGVAVALTKSHGHIGAAGIYSRIALQHDLFSYVTSGHQLNLNPEQSVLAAAGGSPMSFALPTGSEPPFVLDFGAVHDMYPGSPHVRELVELAPGTVFRSIGLGCVCQALGGFLAGVPLDPARASRRWEGANQGSFMICVDLKLFGQVEDFKAEMDAYSRAVRAMQPLPGYDQALLAGGLEWGRERRSARDGIAVGPRHAERLRQAAAAVGIDAPL